MNNTDALANDITVDIVAPMRSGNKLTVLNGGDGIV